MVEPTFTAPSEVASERDVLLATKLHVLGKLGAANRTEAVTRARELSLIP
jgi:ATP/maltotriose-dependent transcriptional regulator MalT